MKLNCQAFIELVKNTPLVSIDLIVRNVQDEILLGLRNNNPAKHFWFVPGGRIFKNEQLHKAFSRITGEELGLSFDIHTVKFIGVFEHLYAENFAQEPGFGTHYIVLAYELKLGETVMTPPKDQHCAYKWVTRDVLVHLQDVHPYTKSYFETRYPLYLRPGKFVKSKKPGFFKKPGFSP